MIAILMMIQAAASPQRPRVQCTPALVAKATPAGWASPVSARGTLPIGRATTVLLVKGAPLPVPASRDGPGRASLLFVVPRAGRWRVSLDSAAWADVVQDGRAIAPIGQSHGAPCSSMRKQVDFDLAAGRYVLQLSGHEGGTVRAMVSPA